MHKKTRLIALVLLGLIFLNVNFVSAAVNQTLKDALLPFVDIKYDYANGIIDEVTIYNRALSPEEINALYSLSPQGIGETWNCTIRAVDSTGAEGINSKAITMPGYALPNITGITITPSPAYDDSEINCSAIYGSPDGNKGNVTLSWYNGSSLFLQTTQYNKFSGESVNEPLTWADRNGLVGYWKFSEGNGTVTKDISGNENNGTLTNFNWDADSGWGDGKYGKAVQFDGVNDYVDAGNAASLNITSAITVTAWVLGKSFNPSGSWIAVLSKETATGGYEIQMNKARQSIGFQFYGDGAWRLSPEFAISPNIWYHLVGTFDGSVIRFYVNGIEISPATNFTGSISLSASSLLIGKNPTQPGREWNGTIDEVMIYNRSLTSDEISALYQNAPHFSGETWNCTINATDSASMAGMHTSTAITISSKYTPRWMHVTVTYNKVTKQKKIYVNGILARTETLQGLSDYKINNQTGNLYAGKLYGLLGGNPFNGSIDEIMISPNEKSAAEIWQDYLNNIIYGGMPGPNEAKTMAIEGENVTEISIAPIVRVRNKEKTCDVTSKVKLPQCVQ